MPTMNKGKPGSLNRTAALAKVRAAQRKRHRGRRTSPYLVACHEAAHALLSLYLGVGFKRIWLESSKRGVEGNEEPKRRCNFWSNPNEERIIRNRFLAEATVSLVGFAFNMAAIGNLGPRSRRAVMRAMIKSWGGDWYNAQGHYYDAGRSISPISKKADRYLLDVLLPRLERWVEEHIHAIHEIGSLLQIRRKLTESEVKKVLRSSKDRFFREM
jgi:hypothetical protein